MCCWMVHSERTSGSNEAQREWKGFVWTNFISVLLSPVIVVRDKKEHSQMGHNSPIEGIMQR